MMELQIIDWVTLTSKILCMIWKMFFSLLTPFKKCPMFFKFCTPSCDDLACYYSHHQLFPSFNKRTTEMVQCLCQAWPTWWKPASFPLIYTHTHIPMVYIQMNGNLKYCRSLLTVIHMMKMMSPPLCSNTNTESKRMPFSHFLVFQRGMNIS